MEKEWNFNELTEAEIERLAILSEELGEVQQIIGKILRHGYGSFNPFDEKQTRNRELLEKELGDVNWIIQFMTDKRDINADVVTSYTEIKKKKVNQYLHHNEV